MIVGLLKLNYGVLLQSIVVFEYCPVNGKKTERLYAKAFAIDNKKVYPVGLPKTDDIIRRKQRTQNEGINSDKTFIYKKYN